MHLLQQDDNGNLTLAEFSDKDIPCYGILSHRWLPRDEEPTHQDIVNRTGTDKPGYKKLRFCGGRAAKDGLKYFWVDTVCINRTDSEQLSEAIRSMFHWYRDAARCYVQLSDVNYTDGKNFDSDFQQSTWFTRGWTLQELIAPRTVQFFDESGKELGDKAALEKKIQSRTGIPLEALRGAPLYQFDIKERISWAKNRSTTREEDKAYCLFGIFDISMPVLYGEGKKAYSRLIEAVEKMTTDKDKPPNELEELFDVDVPPHPIEDSNSKRAETSDTSKITKEASNSARESKQPSKDANRPSPAKRDSNPKGPDTSGTGYYDSSNPTVSRTRNEAPKTKAGETVKIRDDVSRARDGFPEARGETQRTKAKTPNNNTRDEPLRVSDRTLKLRDEPQQLRNEPQQLRNEPQQLRNEPQQLRNEPLTRSRDEMPSSPPPQANNSHFMRKMQQQYYNNGQNAD